MRQKKQVIRAVVISGFLSIVGYGSADAQTPGLCSVAITSPQVGDRVGADGQVTGTATVPPGKFLWVFSHRKGLQGWWPQGGGDASPEANGDWSVSINYGESKDIGRDFEIAAVIVDNQAQVKLQAWVEEANKTGRYPPVTFPASAAKCLPSAKVIVQKEL
jgi:hypothetical protein